MWLTVFKLALVAFLVIAVGVVVVIFVRNSRAKGFPTPQSSSHLGQIKGAMPPTPKPGWADGRDDDDDPDGHPRGRRS
jgi:hypothetical protein